MTEEQIVKLFFSTNTGKKVVQILRNYKTQSSEIVQLNQRVNQLQEIIESRDQEIPLDAQEEKETIQLIDGAISLLNSPKKPEYLFSITDESGNIRGVYSSNIEEIMRNAVECE